MRNSNKDNAAVQRFGVSKSMIIANKDAKEIIITAADGEVLAVISDTEIIEQDGIKVNILFTQKPGKGAENA